MQLPIGGVDAADFDGVSGVNHFPAAQINAYMGSAACVVGALEENQVTGTGLRCRNDGTLATPVLGGLPAKMEPGTAVVDCIGNKAGTVKAAGTVPAPDIRRSEILLCLGNKLCCLAGGFSVNGIQNASNIQIKIGIEAGIPIAERKRHFACAANLGDDLSLCDFRAHSNGNIGTAADCHSVTLFVFERNYTAGNPRHLPIHDGECRCTIGNQNFYMLVFPYGVPGALITVAVQNVAVPIHVNGGAEHNAVAFGNLVDVIHFQLLVRKAAAKNAFKINEIQRDVAD